jgi:hypothetical protein
MSSLPRTPADQILNPLNNDLPAAGTRKLKPIPNHVSRLLTINTKRSSRLERGGTVDELSACINQMENLSQLLNSIHTNDNADENTTQKSVIIEDKTITESPMEESSLVEIPAEVLKLMPSRSEPVEKLGVKDISRYEDVNHNSNDFAIPQSSKAEKMVKKRMSFGDSYPTPEYVKKHLRTDSTDSLIPPDPPVPKLPAQHNAKAYKLMGIDPETASALSPPDKLISAKAFKTLGVDVSGPSSSERSTSNPRSSLTPTSNMKNLLPNFFGGKNSPGTRRRSSSAGLSNSLSRQLEAAGLISRIEEDVPSPLPKTQTISSEYEHRKEQQMQQQKHRKTLQEILTSVDIDAPLYRGALWIEGWDSRSLETIYRRFFIILVRGRLYYFPSSHPTQTYLGWIPLNNFTTVSYSNEQDRTTGGHVILIVYRDADASKGGKETRWRLKTETQFDAGNWVREISSAKSLKL